jgi:hypothetical protein
MQMQMSAGLSAIFRASDKPNALASGFYNEAVESEGGQLQEIILIIYARGMNSITTEETGVLVHGSI